jgi:hypothetical protein
MWRDRQRRIHLSADEARGGEIVLTTPVRRAVFLGGLVGGVILAALAAAALV